MGALFKRYKFRFRFALKPFFVMISDKYKEVPDAELTKKIALTTERILANPVEYLGNDLPDPSLLKDVLDEVFDDFVKERAFRERSITRMRS